VDAGSFVVCQLAALVQFEAQLTKALPLFAT
jgi:hypothetical protein